MDVIPLGRLQIRPIQWYLSEFKHPISQLWEAPVPILPRLLPHLQWTSTYSSNPVVSVGVLAPNFSVVGGTCSNSSSVVTSSSMVASGKTSSEGSFVGSSRPQPNSVHRCEFDGLGSLSGGQDSIRPLVRCSVGGTHQSARDESCVPFSPSVSGCGSGSVTTGCHGQLHSSGLSSESRRHPFLFSVSSEQGNSSSVSQSRYNSVSETCSRQSKSSGGCSLPFPCSSEHRMGNSSKKTIAAMWKKNIPFAAECCISSFDVGR
ncbi:Hypothetical predicted protein [Mytilus galloprovincialis]|uniref:Uncharacterized protein n=1 Tax=Mytilus galloprovincialis TaxID=29158 RepID=A0A8B6GYG3_MYTGA|nr:Hypothetical predicted protein [Mytilus galloprovincialis]